MKTNSIYKLRLAYILSLGLLAILIGLIGIQEVRAQVYHASIGGPNGRMFPAEAYRGVFIMEGYPVVQLNGKREHLPPGARIMDSANRIMNPSMLMTGQRYAVNYVRSANGTLNTIWLLTRQEAAERRGVENPGWWKKAKDQFIDWALLIGVLL